ncbi:MAG: ABC transporter substrate-binding protein [Burkholderiales bacterium]|nr:ABC transporter substrate-binding protein [Burkholderiales bacterium]
MLKTRRLAAFSALLAALFLLLPTGPAEAQTRLRVSMGWRFQGPQAIFLLAREKGYFKAEGLDVQIDPGMGSAGSIQRLVSGAYDIAVGDTSTLIEFLGNNPGQARMQVVYMFQDQSAVTIWTLKRHNIKSLKDLDGKTVSGAPFETARRLWPMIARVNGMKPDTVKWANMDAQIRASAVIRGDALAMGGFSNAWNEFTARGIPRDEVIGFSLVGMGIDIYGDAVMATSKIIDENPRAVAGFLRAFNRAFVETWRNPQPTVDLLKKLEPLSDPVIELQNLEAIKPFVMNDFTRANGYGLIRKTKLEAQVEDVSAALGVKSRASPDIIFNSSFLPARSERTP